MADAWASCLLHEDQDLVAVAKPQGVNTHSPDEHAQEGIYEWVRRRKGADLGLAHRLDKETSGVLLMAKSPRGKKALADQNVPNDVKVYPGATHAFLNEYEGAKGVMAKVLGMRYDPDAAADAWRRILAFFSDHLNGPA